MWIKKKNRPISPVLFIGLSAFKLVKLSEHKSPRIREQQYNKDKIATHILLYNKDDIESIIFV